MLKKYSDPKQRTTAIKRARKSFKELRGKQYSVSEEELARRLPAVEPPPPATPIVLPTEISAETEAEGSSGVATETQPETSPDTPK